MHVALSLALVFASVAGASAPDAGSPTVQAAHEAAPEATPAADAGVSTDLAPDVAPTPANANANANDTAGVPAVAPVERFPLTLHVKARGSRDPVLAASALEGAVVRAEADERGDLLLSLPAGRHVLQISADGFLLQTLVTEIPAPTPELTVRLARAPGGHRYQSVVRAAPVVGPARISLTQEEAAKTPGGLGDPFRVITSLPGVAPLALAVPAFAVRGSNPGNTGFFLDDVRIPALFHFALGPAVVQPGFIDRIDFYPGSYPARFGRFVGGAVVASTPAPPSDRVRGSTDVRLYDASALVSSPFDGGKGNVMVGGRYSYTGGLLSLLSPNLIFDYWDYQLRAEHQLGPGKLTLLTFGSHDRLGKKQHDMGSANQDLSLGFHRVSLRYAQPLGPGRATASMGVGEDASLVPFEGNNQLALTAWSASPRLAYTQDFGTHVSTEVGVEGTWEAIRAVVSGNSPPASSQDVASFAQSRDLRLIGGWVTAALNLHPRLSVAPSLRWDSYQEAAAHARDLAPRLDVRWRLAESTWLKANGGHFTQLPTLPLALPGVEGFALASLGLQSSWQGAVGVETTLPWKLSWESNLFVQRGTLSDIRDLGNRGSAFLDDFLTKREALSYGAELLLRRPATEKLYGWISYTLSWSLRAYEGGVVAPSDWDQRHVLNLVAGWRFGANTFGARFHVRTGRLVAVEGSQTPEVRRLPTFEELDLRAEHRFTYETFVVDLYLETVNTTFSRDNYAYRYDSESGKVVTDGYRIVLPSLGARATF